ncbi:putative Prolactin regulatory element-binding protein [Zostera marina]|uniref:Putative Prolactin regulatory element-binding protein n=1 Tax=Zostera marina TaxID=29655 RepID=A0A0K9NHS1_ZOSMR|nr:putative Prolactin regulatory element-binding protein [Zostera marina]
MGRGRRQEISLCCKRYGSPLFCAAWIPNGRASASTEEEKVELEAETKMTKVEEEKDDEKRCDDWMLVLGGGGGEGRSGVPNAVLMSRFDPISRSLSDQPIYRIETEGEVPYRMAIHPRGDGVLCSFPKRCRWFEWRYSKDSDGGLTLESSERSLSHLGEDELQLALTFNHDGSLLAAGNENGHLRVFKWLGMDLILDKSDAHASVKDLSFSTDGNFLVSLGDSGPCRVWDTKSCSVIASLPRETGESFRFCRFSQGFDNNQTLYIAAMQGERGRIVSWSPLSWKRIVSKEITRDPISAFSVSADGNFLAVGTSEGDVVISNSLNMRKVTVVKKAHLGLVTAMAFKDSSALVSTSFDASARVTLVGDKSKNGIFSTTINILVVIFVILLAAIVYYMRKEGFFR